MKFTEKMATLLIGASLLATAAAEAAEWNFATTSTIDSHYGAAQQAFKEKIEALSNGDIIVNLKPNGVLGGEREVLEGMQIGTIELALTSTGAVGNFVPEVYALDFPFLFKDYAGARAVLDGEIGQSLLDKFDAIGLEALAWGENGFRHVTNSQHPVKTPEDLAGLKLRTMENQVHIAAFEAAGAAPTPMSWTEVLTALQQGTIDGQENPIPILVVNKIWDVQTYVTLTGHVYSPAVLVMSKITWDGLSEEEQGWVREAAKDAVVANRAYVDKSEAEGVAILQENGMEVITAIDKDAFAAAVQPAYDEYADEYGADLIKQIQDAQK